VAVPQALPQALQQASVQCDRCQAWHPLPTNAFGHYNHVAWAQKDDFECR
jgi:hypothetical protein